MLIFVVRFNKNDVSFLFFLKKNFYSLSFFFCPILYFPKIWFSLKHGCFFSFSSSFSREKKKEVITCSLIKLLASNIMYKCCKQCREKTNKLKMIKIQKRSIYDRKARISKLKHLLRNSALMVLLFDELELCLVHFRLKYRVTLLNPTF